LIESGVPVEVVHQLLDDLKRIFHHHMVLTDRYVARPYPGPITLIRPSEAPFAVPVTSDRGWEKLAAYVDVHFVPGQHHSMVKEPYVQDLARVLHACLRQGQSGLTSLHQGR
jgi:thioesterase domain-containing protein